MTKSTVPLLAVALVVLTLPVAAVAGSVAGTFSDDDGNVHEAAIEAIVAAEITFGCSSTRFCPSDPVTRAQMASFLTRALHLTPLDSGPFTDIAGSVHEGDINALAAAGITYGCEVESFCPDDGVTREQMASFLTRAFEVDPAPPFGFDDVAEDNVHRNSIDAIAAAGITVGCAQGQFCPGEPVLRDQMASFLSRALDLDPIEPPTPPASDEGLVSVAVNAKSDFDPWTKAPSAAEQARMRELYDTMIVRSPYFDSRTSWYPAAIAYIDLHAIYTDLDRDPRSQTHPEWILKDGDGDFLYIDWGCSGGTCPQYAGDPGHPGFRADFVDMVSDLIAEGYAGIMIDDVNMLWRISDGNGDEAIPIDPRTGAPMTLADWRRYVAEMVEEVRDAFPAIDIMHNAIWFSDTPDFDDPYIDRQIAAADWIMLERGANDGGLVGGFSSKWSIHSLFEYVESVHSLGAGVLYLDEDADSLAEQEYNLAAYLLTSDGNDLVSTEDWDLINPDTTWTGFTLDLGTAEGSRYQWRGVTRRDFTGGMVLLADPDSSTATIALPETFHRIDGSTVTSITLGAGSGAVLLQP